MRSLDELEKRYNSDLKKQLSSLESTRKSIKQGYIIGFTIAGLVALLSAASLANGIPPVGFFFSFIIVLITFFALRGKRKEYIKQYKHKVVKEIVHLIDSNWQYSPMSMIQEGTYKRSGLFSTSYDRYNGDDLVRGVIDKTDFECSELHTEYKSESRDSDGKTQTSYVTIFKGLFFHADFNKQFKGETFVRPDFSEKYFGGFGRKIQKLTGGKSLVRLENPDFEKDFVVHSSDQIEARYLLTPTIMEAIMRINKRFPGKVYLSFVGSRVYCAMSFESTLFEPSIWKSSIDFKEVKYMFNLFMMNATIIEELNLNTRIWTKD